MKRLGNFFLFLFVFLFIWVLTFSHAAMALPKNKKFYIGVQGGLAVPGNNSNTWWNTGAWNTGYDIGVQAGYLISNFRVEWAISYLNHTLEQASDFAVGITTIMGNAYYDFSYGNYVIPFVGIGGGYLSSWLSYTPQNFNNGLTKNTFGYQGIFGIALPITDKIGFDLSYHYLAWTNASGCDNVLQAGLNFFF